MSAPEISCELVAPPLKLAYGDPPRLTEDQAPSQTLTDGLTVGREFILECSGDWPKDLNAEALKISSSEGDEFSLKVLRSERRDTLKWDLGVTSYRVGQHDLSQFTLSDGTHSFQFRPLSFEIISVQSGATVDPKPLGPFGPIVMPWPFSYTVILGILVLGTLALGALWVYLLRKKQEWRRKLKELNKASGPAQEFYSRWRQGQRVLQQLDLEADGEIPRGVQALESLEMAFRIFLSREFQVRALPEYRGSFYKDLKKNWRGISRRRGPEIRSFFKQLQAGRIQNQKWSETDYRQLFSEAQKLVETLDSDKQKLLNDEDLR